jgi:hypothetical protein
VLEGVDFLLEGLAPFIGPVLVLWRQPGEPVQQGLQLTFLLGDGLFDRGFGLRVFSALRLVAFRFSSRPGRSFFASLIQRRATGLFMQLQNGIAVPAPEFQPRIKMRHDNLHVRVKVLDSLRQLP